LKIIKNTQNRYGLAKQQELLPTTNELIHSSTAKKVFQTIYRQLITVSDSQQNKNQTGMRT